MYTLFTISDLSVIAHCKMRWHNLAHQCKACSHSEWQGLAT